MLPETVFRFYCKKCYDWMYQDVIFSFIWIGTILQLDDCQRGSRRAFLFHAALWWNSKSSGEKMDLLVFCWLEVDSGVKIKYLTSVMFGHAKAQDVVTMIFKALDKLPIPLKLMLSLGMDGPNMNKSILNKLNQIKRRKAINSLSSAHQVVWFIFATVVPRKEL